MSRVANKRCSRGKPQCNLLTYIDSTLTCGTCPVEIIKTGNGNDSIRCRNSLDHMAPQGLTGERYISHWANKDREKRVTAVQEIKGGMGKWGLHLSTEDVKKKIDIIRNQHRQEMQRARNSVKAGAGAQDIYSPSVWCYDLLSFLNDSDEPRPFGQ